MAPPPTEGQKIEYLTHLQYVHSAEAARRAGINVNTAKKERGEVRGMTSHRQILELSSLEWLPLIPLS